MPELKWVRDRAISLQKRIEEFTGNFTKPVTGGMCSGSRQPADNEFENIAKITAEHPDVEHLIFVDLRDEPHLHSSEQGPMGMDDVSGNEESLDKDSHYDAEQEEKLAKSLEQDQELDLYSKIKTPKAAKDIEKAPKAFEHNWCVAGKLETEKNLVKRLAEKFEAKLKISYQRFPVVDNHIPSDAVVDAFVNWAMQLPPKTWVHFHCHGGKGRTATFMAMYNLCYFAKNPGAMPSDFDPMASPRLQKGGDAEPEGGRKQRIEFMTKFNAYMALVKHNLKVHKDSPSWSEWQALEKESFAATTPRAARAVSTYNRGGGDTI